MSSTPDLSLFEARALLGYVLRHWWHPGKAEWGARVALDAVSRALGLPAEHGTHPVTARTLYDGAVRWRHEHCNCTCDRCKAGDHANCRMEPH